MQKKGGSTNSFLKTQCFRGKQELSTVSKCFQLPSRVTVVGASSAWLHGSLRESHREGLFPGLNCCLKHFSLSNLMDFLPRVYCDSEDFVLEEYQLQ